MENNTQTVEVEGRVTKKIRHGVYVYVRGREVLLPLNAVEELDNGKLSISRWLVELKLPHYKLN